MVSAYQDPAMDCLFIVSGLVRYWSKSERLTLINKVGLEVWPQGSDCYRKGVVLRVLNNYWDRVEHVLIICLDI